MKTGQISLMDARVIQAKHHRPNQGAAGESTQATEAAYKVKQSSDGQQKTTDGYKAHFNVEEDGLISKAITTAGLVHDSPGFAPWLTGEAPAVTADSADASEAHHTGLKQSQVKNGMLKRAYRNTPLTVQQISNTIAY